MKRTLRPRIRGYVSFSQRIKRVWKDILGNCPNLTRPQKKFLLDKVVETKLSVEEFVGFPREDLLIYAEHFGEPRTPISLALMFEIQDEAKRVSEYNGLGEYSPPKPNTKPVPVLGGRFRGGRGSVSRRIPAPKRTRTGVSRHRMGFKKSILERVVREKNAELNVYPDRASVSGEETEKEEQDAIIEKLVNRSIGLSTSGGSDEEFVPKEEDLLDDEGDVEEMEISYRHRRRRSSSEGSGGSIGSMEEDEEEGISGVFSRPGSFVLVKYLEAQTQTQRGSGFRFSVQGVIDWGLRRRVFDRKWALQQGRSLIRSAITLACSANLLQRATPPQKQYAVVNWPSVDDAVSARKWMVALGKTSEKSVGVGYHEMCAGYAVLKRAGLKNKARLRFTSKNVADWVVKNKLKVGARYSSMRNHVSITLRRLLSAGDAMESVHTSGKGIVFKIVNWKVSTWSTSGVPKWRRIMRNRRRGRKRSYVYEVPAYGDEEDDDDEEVDEYSDSDSDSDSSDGEDGLLVGVAEYDDDADDEEEEETTDGEKGKDPDTQKRVDKRKRSEEEEEPKEHLELNPKKKQKVEDEEEGKKEEDGGEEEVSMEFLMKNFSKFI